MQFQGSPSDTKGNYSIKMSLLPATLPSRALTVAGAMQAEVRSTERKSDLYNYGRSRMVIGGELEIYLDSSQAGAATLEPYPLCSLPSEPQIRGSVFVPYSELETRGRKDSVRQIACAVAI
jgi:hypothetical protein